MRLEKVLKDVCVHIYQLDGDMATASVGLDNHDGYRRSEISKSWLR